jgi:sortase A
MKPLRRSWPVLIGTLCVLFGSQQVADLLAGPASLPQENYQAALPARQADLDPPVAEPSPGGLPPASSQPAAPPPSLAASSVRSQETASAPIPAPARSSRPNSSEPAVAGPQLPPGPPTRLVLPSIDLDAPIVPAETKTVSVAGKQYQQWEAPDRYAAGWHTSSAELGLPGNTVLNGHNNIEGEVFKRLEEVSVGDEILVYSFEGIFGYQVTNRMILPEKYEGLDVRMNNAQWILPSQDERLTLVTCWPYESNTHRLIIVARPIFRQKIVRDLQ